MIRRLAELTYEEVETLVGARAVALLPVGSVEPHGPHLPLETDTRISLVCAERAAPRLEAEGIPTVIAPAIPYGVTDYASGFAGAIGVTAAVLTAFVRDVVGKLLDAGFVHVCVINNHLEPAHDAAIRAALADRAPGATSVACPLTRRWGKTLSDEFKRGDCHAGRYETSLMLAADTPVRPAFTALPKLGWSLSDAIRAGKATFTEIGMDRAYTGAPSEASSGEGDDLYERLVTMVVTEVREALEKR